MLVPAAMEDLNEPHAALGQPPGQEAAASKGPRCVHVRTVQLEECLGSLEMSISSGTEVCMRKAISYWAIRV